MAAIILATAAAFAHEGRDEGEYRMVVGFLDEPAYEGQRNAVSLRVTKGSSDGQHGEMAPVEGLESTLQVEVTHVATGVSRTMNLRAVFDDPGHYSAALIPTAPGHYRFRFIGSIEGEAIDSTFDSASGGGDFDDVQVASAIHFPEELPSSRELVSVVRGGQTAIQQAQDAAIMAEDSAGSASTLGLIGVILGVIGIATGAVAVVVAMRSRNG